MAPINYQHQHDRHLEDGLALHRDEKLGLKEETSRQPQVSQTSPPQARKMNLRRFTVTCGVGFLVGFGLVTASRSRPHRSLCSEEIHAANDHEMKALVEQTKDDTSALSDILRCASPETFHRIVSVYFPDKTKPEADGRAEAIGHDETWLLTAWDKLVKRQDEGAAGSAATPSNPDDTDNAAGAVTQTTTVTQGNEDPGVSEPPVNDDPTTTEDTPAEPTTSDPPVDGGDDNNDGESTSVEEPSSSSTSEEAAIPTTTEDPVSSSDPLPESTTSTTSTTSEEEPTEESTTEQAPETTTTSSTSTQEPEPESTTSEDVPPSSFSTTTSSSERASSTVPEETTTSHEEEDRPSKTTIHRSSAVKETITRVNDDGGVTTITSTSWVGVDPPEETSEEGESDSSLQDAGMSLRANVGPAVVIGGIVTMLLMS